MTRAVAMIVVALATEMNAQQPPRQLVEALAAIYRLREFTAFDWIGGRFDRGTLTLEGLVRTPNLKKLAEETARGPFDIGAATTVTIAAPPGTYYAVLNAFNGCGPSADSNEIVVRVPQTAPSAFSIEMPLTAGDSAREAFGLNPFGIHFGGTGAGGHGLDGHLGWDIEYRIGGVVRAAADGIVQSRFADPFAPDRVTVQIHHPRGALAFRTVYTNLTGSHAEHIVFVRHRRLPPRTTTTSSTRRERSPSKAP